MMHLNTLRTVLFATASTAALFAFPQARMVINDNAWLRIDNGAWVVLENPATNALSTAGTGGNISSEGEFDRIRWQIRNNTGIYTLPFTTANGVKMPFTYEVVAAGSNDANASICFSTYNYGTVGANNWDNNTYRPSDVTHMFNYWTGSPLNNSDNVVDRFWEVDPGASGFAYTTKPTVRLGFTYDPGAATGDVRTGNAITGATSVGAQRFNPSGNMWGDYWPQGNWSAGAVNSVTNVNVDPANFFRSWTLSNFAQPLPVELVEFNAACDKGHVLVSWSTGSEVGSDRYDVERSSDAQHFEVIGSVQAAGSSNGLLEYSFIDTRPLGRGYYRLHQVDVNGMETYSELRATDCNALGGTFIVNAWDGGDDVNILVQASGAQEHLVRLIDAAGKEVWSSMNVPLAEGINTLRIPQYDLAMGIYTIRFDGPDGAMTRRVALY
ncbi:MAG TPA: hypothetical protein PK760_01170 [Flavobacteriales bacterium]|nr:hypothetical protein [Flavobacteriales bacterium]